MRLVSGVILLCVLLAGCASRPVVVEDRNEPEPGGHADPEQTVSMEDYSVDMANPGMVHALLSAQLREWEGTPYRLGGMTRKGVDCSGFVFLTFHDRLGVRLPRTTDQQARVGEKVAKDQLQTGDLVFFRTGRGVRHVGIYMNHGRFMHASTSRGVMISSLDNVYWRSHYWTARRIETRF
ncbi:NLP/P60 protein [Alcanivorax xiamenensis]|uniref:NLP/P60 protein n=1 Tax=Alcanivorax xiamenensis TaxID=1177156 RepID=A0ABQ6YC82_9GAMM|nr:MULTISPECIES: NlpC/P60 family protein [Alcanivorax]KAF0807334.1 NLP/P60 protein [Alcanivorax xiamenensis]